MTTGPPSQHLVTERLTLRQWREDDRIPFAAMNADAEVMHDLGGVLDVDESNRKLDRFAAAFGADGYGRWVVEGSVAGAEPAFLGYTGVMPSRDADHPLGHHNDIGWRLCRQAWGDGIATEAARATLRDVFDRVGLTEVVAYTAPENLRSQRMMGRLGLRRERSLDFRWQYEDVGVWHGLVWVATNTGAPRAG